MTTWSTVQLVLIVLEMWLSVALSQLRASTTVSVRHVPIRIVRLVTHLNSAHSATPVSMLHLTVAAKQKSPIAIFIRSREQAVPCVLELIR